jgi:hypothetical protein
MSISFNFRNRETNEVVTLSHIDAEVCKFFGTKVDEENFSPEYMDLTAFAIGASYNAPQSIPNEESVEEQLKNTSWSEAKTLFFKEFLLKRYIFQAWR